MSDTPKRGWLSFSIRDIMLATAIVAILVTWWLDRSRLDILWKSAETERQKNAVELKAATAQYKEARDYLTEEQTEIQRLGIRHTHVKGRIVLRPPPYYGDSAPGPNPPKN